MRRLLPGLCLGVILAGSARAGEATGVGSVAPKDAAIHCEVAEVNPVTGHVSCIRPLGAPVEAPEATEDAPCKPDRREAAAWTWHPKCRG